MPDKAAARKSYDKSAVLDRLTYMPDTIIAAASRCGLRPPTEWQTTGWGFHGLEHETRSGRSKASAESRTFGQTSFAVSITCCMIISVMLIAP